VDRTYNKVQTQILLTARNEKENALISQLKPGDSITVRGYVKKITLGGTLKQFVEIQPAILAPSEQLSVAPKKIEEQTANVESKVGQASIDSKIVKQINLIVNQIEKSCPTRIKEQALNQVFWDSVNQRLIAYEPTSPTSGSIFWVSLRDNNEGRSFRYKYKTTEPHGEMLQEQGISSLNNFQINQDTFTCKFNSILKIGDVSKIGNEVYPEVVECSEVNGRFKCLWK
jgi:hypothetical protein